jgi:hypothetical protein
LYVTKCKNVIRHSNKILQKFAKNGTVMGVLILHLVGMNVIIWDVVPWPPHTVAPELSDLLSKQKYSNV